MNPAWRRALALLDVAGMALLIPVFIWRLQFSGPRSWIVFPIWIVASFLLHRDSPKTLGWRADNLIPATRNATIAFFAMVIVLVLTGAALGEVHLAPVLAQFSWRRLWLYFAFCLLQQVALQSFLNNRLMSLVRQRWVSSLLAGIIFASAHWPNPVLVPVTLAGGALMAWLFARHRNVLPLAVGQALLGSVLWICFPVEWHHRLRVGPGYLRPL